MQLFLLKFMRSENRTQIEGKLLSIYYHIFVKNVTVIIGKNMLLVSVSPKILHTSNFPRAEREHPK